MIIIYHRYKRENMRLRQENQQLRELLELLEAARAAIRAEYLLRVTGSEIDTGTEVKL